MQQVSDTSEQKDFGKFIEFDLGCILFEESTFDFLTIFCDQSWCQGNDIG